jgi:hypothetical protein
LHDTDILMIYLAAVHITVGIELAIMGLTGGNAYHDGLIGKILGDVPTYRLRRRRGGYGIGGGTRRTGG